MSIAGGAFYDWFQYPLRVLGCEKIGNVGAVITPTLFQYPLRVLGCEKPPALSSVSPSP